MSQPEVAHWEWFCRELLPEILVDACQVPADDANGVADEVERRGRALAALDQEERERLSAPFFEETFAHSPEQASLWLKAFVAVAVRNSRLEEMHVQKLVYDGGIQKITEYATGPLSHIIAAARGDLVAREHFAPFAELGLRFPRAWACLGALSSALNEGGGRIGYRAPTAPVPPVPGEDELVDAPRADELAHQWASVNPVVFSGVDPRFDQGMFSNMLAVADGGEGTLVGVTKLSRFSRDTSKLLRVLEFFLARDCRIITTNYLLTASDVSVRRKELVEPNSVFFSDDLPQRSGLSGVHRKTLISYLELMRGSQ